MRRLAAIVPLAALLISGCQLLPAEEELPPIDVISPVVTERAIHTVGTGPLEKRVQLTASLGAETQQALYFRRSGRVRAVHVRPGEEVAAGQVLAELELGAAKYDLAQAELDAAQAMAAWERVRQLPPEAVSAAELERYEADWRQADIRLGRQRDTVEGGTLTAPFAGTVVTIRIVAGDMADEYAEVAVVAADGPLVAYAKIDEMLVAQLEPGQTAYIYPSDGDNRPLPAQVATVPMLGGSAREMQITVAPLEPSPRLQVGRNARVEIVTASRDNVVLVPLSAVRTYSGRKFVTIVEGETRSEVAITTGLEGQEFIEVIEGLQPGDRVVGR